MELTTLGYDTGFFKAGYILQVIPGERICIVLHVGRDAGVSTLTVKYLSRYRPIRFFQKIYYRTKIALGCFKPRSIT